MIWLKIKKCKESLKVLKVLFFQQQIQVWWEIIYQRYLSTF